MVISYLGLLIIIILAIILANFIQSFLARQFAGAPQGMPGPKPPMNDLLAELNMLVKLECIALIEVPQSVKTIPLITEFNELQIRITHNILESLSSNFWRTCNMAGLTRQYIIRYVTRNTQAEMLQFMSEHNYAMSTDEPEIPGQPNQEETKK